MKKKVREIAELVGGTVVSGDEVQIRGVNRIEHAQEGDLTFVTGPRYERLLGRTRASAIIVPRDISKCAKPLIQVDDPYAAFMRVLEVVREEVEQHPTHIHPAAAIGKNVTLGKNVAVGPYACIADDALIGDGVVVYAGAYVGRLSYIGAGTIVYPNATIRERVRIGARCIIHSGAVIGGDGFGFVEREGRWWKVPQVGTVVIGDDVEIGSNTTIDRATCGRTEIGRGTKIDNLVQIGHNVVVGEDCVISGMVGIAGSAVLGNSVKVGATAGIVGHVEIGDRVEIAARSGVTKSIAAGARVSGFPAKEHHEEKRIVASVRRLPELLRRVKRLEAEIEELEGRLHGKAENNT